MEQFGSKQTSFSEASLGRLADQDAMRVILCHFHIGHTFLTDTFILAGDHAPQCEHCQCILTVCHILVRSPHLKLVRDGVFGNEGVMETFRFHPQLIINLFIGKLVFIRNSFVIFN